MGYREGAENTIREMEEEITKLKGEYRIMYMRYIGAMKLLEECSVHVDSETRACISTAIHDAVDLFPEKFYTKQIINRVCFNLKEDNGG